MRAKEIRERSDDELVRMRDDTEEQLFRDRLKNAVHQFEDTSKIRSGRREIARIKTILRERELAQGSAAAEGSEE
jgi:large subunit ribosomal protein L29